MNELLEHLLVRRQEYPSRVIVDCLALAQLKAKPGRRVSWQLLEAQLQACSHSHMVKRLRDLKAYGLLDCEAGGPSDPGYLIHRVGPA